MGKRALNVAMLVAIFALCYLYTEKDLVSSLIVSQLSLIGYMLYDIHSYLENISEKVS